MKQVILASNSPRRRKLMEEAGYQFISIDTDFDEQFPDNLPPEKIAEHLAKSKNDHYRDRFSDEILITSDTIVVKDDLILAKPEDEKAAAEMLKSLSNGAHLVITGVCVSDPNQEITFHDTTQVFFSPLDHSEIDHYIKHHKPFDKAGAYGIQDWIGLTKIWKIEGSYFNVMGLPVHLLYQTLRDPFGITPFLQ